MNDGAPGRRFTPAVGVSAAIDASRSRTGLPCIANWKRKHVSLLILWDEYIVANPGGYSYSRFCELYRILREDGVDDHLRQTHAAGERLFVDYAGDGVPVVIDRLTGEIRMAQIFSWPCPAHQASPSPRRPGRRRCPTGSAPGVLAFEAIGGVPELVVPDNAKTAIKPVASFYDNRSTGTYAEMRRPRWTAIPCRRGRGSPATRRRSSRPS